MQSKSLKCLSCLSCISMLKNTIKPIVTDKNKLSPQTHTCEQTWGLYVSKFCSCFSIDLGRKRSYKSQKNDSPLSERFSDRLCGVQE